MTLILWVIRVLVILIVLRLVLRLFFGARPAGPAKARPSRRTPERLGGTLVRDPHCGTHVVRERAIMSGAGSSAEYFCSETCREAWLKRARTV